MHFLTYEISKLEIRNRFFDLQIGSDERLPSPNGDSLLVLGDKGPHVDKNVFSTTITEEGAVLPLG